MEVQKVVVKVEVGSVAVQAFATLTGPEATAAGAAGASAALAVELQGAIVDLIEVRPQMDQSQAEADWNKIPSQNDAALRRFPEHWCHNHGIEYKKYSNERGSWYSHQLPGGEWCREPATKAA